MDSIGFNNFFNPNIKKQKKKNYPKGAQTRGLGHFEKKTT
jgi:hypothetical protein